MQKVDTLVPRYTPLASCVLGVAWRCIVLGVVLLALGCSRSSNDGTKQELSVFAASSLTEAFRDLEASFEREHPTVDVRVTLAGSQVLRLQIEQGAPADVFASANEEHMHELATAGLVHATEVFAHNELVVIVPTANPAGIESFEDLVEARRIVVGTPAVPAGAYTREMLSRTRTSLGSAFAETVLAHVVSQESNVRLVRAKIEMGEADAAVVYRTDAVGSGALRIIEIPTAFNVRAAYPIGTVVRSPQAEVAGRFVAHVRSSAGQQTLARHGFVVE